MPYPLSYSANVLEELGVPPPEADVLALGLELECEQKNGSSVSRMLTAIGGPRGADFIVKSDGSLYDGMEIVTLPLTLEQHAARGWRRFLRPLLPIAQSGSGTRRCGIHVHINRSAMSPLTLGKIMVALNAPEWRGFVETIAQRSANTYCRYLPKDWTAARFPDIDKDRTGRYQAVNVNAHTVEIRIFRGSLRHDRVMKAVEFCDALVNWARGASARAVRDPAALIRYIQANRPRYPHLADFLVESNIGAP